jgi:hypothetical protein
VLAAAAKLTVVAGENPTVGSTVWLPAESWQHLAATAGEAAWSRRWTAYSPT